VKLVAVTSCPTGIAHSEMAAEALEVAAKAKGHEIEVEVQGAAGGPPIGAATIAAADAVIFAVDATVRDRDRFAHLPTVEVRTREAIDRAPAIVDQAVAAAERAPARATAGAAAAGAAPADGEKDVFASVTGKGTSKGEEVRRWLMTGVSYMIPFVVGGGILIALSFAIADAVEVTEYAIFVPGEGVQSAAALGIDVRTWLGVLLLAIGGTAFSMLVPVLPASSPSRWPIAPGSRPASSADSSPSRSRPASSAAWIAGLLAGGIVMALKRIPVKGTIKRMMPILVYPIIGTLAVGALMYLVVGEPVAAINAALSEWLNGLSGTNQILLGLMLGLMMAFDMGGPVNKVAYAFGIAALDAGNYQVMAAVMAAGHDPAARAGARHRGAQAPVHRGGARGRRGRLGHGRLVHHRGRDPVRRRRPRAGDPVADGRLRRDRGPVVRLQRHPPGAARWHLGARRDRQLAAVPARDRDRHRGHRRHDHPAQVPRSGDSETATAPSAPAAA
jgi:fructose PTS system EIIBC or EIIC component